MINATSIGDWQQIRQLSKDYNSMLEVKERFVSKALREQMTPMQRAEAELSLAMITGELKRIDGLIHYVMFGGELMPNEVCKSLHWQAMQMLKGEMEFEEPVIQEQGEKTFNQKRLEYLENKTKREFQFRCKLYQENYRLKKQLKEKRASIFTGIPGPLTITVPSDNDFAGQDLIITQK